MKNADYTSLNVSVIIPTFNRAHTISLAIDSVLAQLAPAHEVLVIDDGSTDGTAAMLADKHPSVKLLTQQNHGVSHARNRGIEQASGEWVAFLDSDDSWYPQKLQKQITAINANPGYRLCHCDEHWIRNGKRVNPMSKHQKRGGDIFAHCLPLCAISPSASLIHKSVFNDVGLFDETLPACEDYDLWLRLCSREPVLYVDECLLQKTGGHADQLSGKHWGMDRFRLQSLAKLIRSNNLSDQQSALALRTFEQKYSILHAGSIKRGKQSQAVALEQAYADLTQTGPIGCGQANSPAR